MALSAVQTLSEPGDAEDSYTTSRVHLIPTGRTPFKMRVVRVDFEHLWVQQSHESARLRHVVLAPDRVVFKFLVAPGSELVTQGVALPNEGLLRHCPGQDFHDRTSREVKWASVSLPVEQLATFGIAVADRDLTPLRDASIIVPPTDAMKKLRRLHDAATVLAKKAPQMLSAPEVSHHLEQSLIEALVGCLSQFDTLDATWAQQCHQTVMRRFHQLLEDNPRRPIYVPEICAAIRVPDRTLRLCCREEMGMSPKRYLLLRRMYQARRALSEGATDQATVTEIATRFGFWHLGRFAGTYQSIFGEQPSVTLNRRPPRDACSDLPPTGTSAALVNRLKASLENVTV